MTRRERVLQAIDHKSTDIVPYHIALTSQARDRLTAYTGDKDYIENIGNHLLAVSHGSFVEIESGSGYWRDHFGVIWNRNGVDTDIGGVENHILPGPGFDGLQMPDIDEPALRSACEEVMAVGSDQCRIFAMGFSLFERAWTLRGMENLLMDMAAEQDFAHELFDRICEYNLRVLDIALEYSFDICHFGDDWGQQKGLIMGPACWRKFVKPRLARMYEKVRRSGRFVSQHSCGDVSEVFPDLIKMGLNIYQTFQPEIYDVREVKREYGDELSFWGGISTQRVLPYVTPDEVKRAAREMMAVMSVDGGYIAAPTHDVPGDVPPENIVALAEVFQYQSYR